MVQKACGINLHDGKRQLVIARLTKRIRSLGLGSFKEYLDFIEYDNSLNEFSEMINALTTNKTEFFRDAHHFDYIRAEILPKIRSNKVRVWSAGCSTGEEPYSLAVTLKEYYRESDTDIRILATDISSDVLESAKEGIFEKKKVRHISPLVREKYFTYHRSPESFYKVKPDIKTNITFARLNLMDAWPMKGPFDIIFCRNVMIYFNKTIQARLINRFWRYLGKDGYLFIGHAESLIGLDHIIKYVKPAVYMK
jgi:chemotaxis protein methyltransferase CheR